MNRLGVALACLLVLPSSTSAGASGGDLVVSIFRGKAGDRNLDLALLAGSGEGRLRFLTRVGMDDHSPSWSPAGNQIVFARRGARRGGIYILHGSTTRRLTSGALDGAPAFSPDGGRVAFSRRPGVFVMSSGGRGARLVVATRSAPRQLSWTLDATRLVYGDEGAIPTVDVATGIASGLPVAGYRPLLSPDGSRIAYMGAGGGRYYRDSNWGIYVADSDGANPTRVVDEQFGPVSWQPDGNRLLATNGGALVIVDLAARTLTQLGPAGAGGAFRPT